MIQRVQSIFLFAIAALMAAMLFLPFWSKKIESRGEQAELRAFYLTHSKIGGGDTGSDLITRKATYPLGILAIVCAGVALYSLFRYNNRLVQMKLGALNALVMAALMGLTLWYSRQGDQLIPVARGEYRIAFFLLTFALICNLAANRFIRRDENKVRSADRLR